MTGARAAWSLGWIILAAALIAGALALWWRYGEIIVLSGPAWMCLGR
jgi:hypothetical protein